MQTRYSEIRDLHERLWCAFGDALPSIPPKRLFGNQDPIFIQRRMGELQRVLDGALRLDPQARHPALRSFLTGGLDRGCVSTVFTAAAAPSYAAVRAASARPEITRSASSFTPCSTASFPFGSSFVSVSSVAGVQDAHSIYDGGAVEGTWCNGDRPRSETPGPRRRWSRRQAARDESVEATGERKEARRRWPSALPPSRVPDVTVAPTVSALARVEVARPVVEPSAQNPAADEGAIAAVALISSRTEPEPEAPAVAQGFIAPDEPAAVSCIAATESELPPPQQKSQRKHRTSYPSALPGPAQEATNALVAECSAACSTELLAGGNPRPPSGGFWDWPLSRIETKACVLFADRHLTSLHIGEIEARLTAETRCASHEDPGSKGAKS